MFNTSEGYSLSDIAAVSGAANDSWGGGFGGWWIILLFLFAFGGWGNGNGWGGGSNGITNDVGYSFDIHDLTDGIRDLASSTASGFYGINSSLLNGFSGTQAQVCNTGFETIQAINANTVSGLQNTNALQAQIAASKASADLCCCQTQDAIDRNFATLNYNLATEACADRTAVTTGVRDVIDNANNNTRQILDFLVQDRLSALQNENTNLKNQISQSEQNAYLLNALRPVADPAYIVPNPYTGYYGNNGFNNGFYGYNSCCCNGF